MDANITVTLSYTPVEGYRGQVSKRETVVLEMLPRQGDTFTHVPHGVTYRVTEVEWIFGRSYLDEENEPQRLPTEIVLHLVPR